MRAACLAAMTASLLALPACQTAAQESEAAPPVVKRQIKTIKKQFEYRGLTAPDKIFDTPLDVARHYVGLFPLAVEGRPLIDLKVGRESESAQQLTMLITTGGYLDDATYGEQWRIRMKPVAETESWRVASAEHRYRCGRSGANLWSVEPCP